MDPMLLSLFPFLAALAFVLYFARRRVNCPDCGDPLPVLYSPLQKTRRMWRAGGYLCARCGCETNTAGQKITADTPPSPFPTLQWALLAVLLFVGVGAGFAASTMRLASPPAPLLAVPAVEAPVVVPVTASAVIPAN